MLQKIKNEGFKRLFIVATILNMIIWLSIFFYNFKNMNPIRILLVTTLIVTPPCLIYFFIIPLYMNIKNLFIKTTFIILSIFSILFYYSNLSNIGLYILNIFKSKLSIEFIIQFHLFLLFIIFAIYFILKIIEWIIAGFFKKM